MNVIYTLLSLLIVATNQNSNLTQASHLSPSTSYLLTDTCTYIGGYNGLWNLGSNWSCGHVPLPSDDVIINENYVNIYDSIVVNNLTISSGVALTGPGKLTVNGILDMMSDINCSGVININGDFNWKGNSFTGPGIVNLNGHTTIGANGSVSISGSKLVKLNGGGTWVGNDIFMCFGAVLQIPIGATLVHTGASAQIYCGGNRDGVKLEILGTFRKTTSGTINLGAVPLISNSGTINLENGSTLTMGAPSVFNSSGLMAGNGQFYFNGTTVNLTGSIGPGNSPGIIKFNYYPPGTTNTYIEIQNIGTPGVDYDQILANEAYWPAATGVISGTLNISFLNGFTPTIGNEFIIVKCPGGCTGNFSNIVHPGNNPNAWQIDRSNSTEVKLKLVQCLVGTATWYLDADGDGHAISSTIACISPGVGFTTNVLPIDDCNDANAAIHPGSTELCDGIDNDCDGLLDNGPLMPFYKDNDGDSYGNPLMSVMACAAPPMYVSNNTDCNDAAIAIHPGAQEICDGSNVDEDCDGLTDDNDPSATGMTTWYQDLDLDGYGSITVTLSKCDQPGGYIAVGGDCNDGNAAIRPGATEICGNSIDENCDGVIANVPAGALHFDGSNDYVNLGNWLNYQEFTIEMWLKAGSTQATYADIIDNNHTGFQNWVCQQNGSTTNSYNFGVNVSPTGSGVGVNFTLTPNIWQHVTLVKSLTAVKAYVNGSLIESNAYSGTINYANQNINLGKWGGGGRNWNGAMDDLRIWNKALSAAEIANHFNCELPCTAIPGLVAYYKMNQGVISCSNSTQTTLIDETGNHNGTLVSFALNGNTSNFIQGNVASNCTLDQDNDGYTLCGNPVDCDDTNAAIHPGATELCDGMDNDCDGNIDNGTLITFYKDNDGDTYGNPLITVFACAAPLTYVNNNLDCNDAVASIHPGAVDNTCDDIDQDCDGLFDEAAPMNTYFRDQDGDGFGNPAISKDSCALPLGFVANNSDCNDAVPSIHPGAADNTCDGIDQDCDGLVDEDSPMTTYYRDADGDGYGNLALTKDSCAMPTGYVANSADCNDIDAAIHPGVADSNCNGIDENCNGTADEGYIAANCLSCQNGLIVNSSMTWYLDADGDGHAFSSTVSCTSPGLGYTLSVLPIGDCDDSNISVFQLTGWYLDQDNDGFGDGNTSIAACTQPTGYVSNNTDCNDDDANIHPGVSDVNCNGIDEDCDGTADDGYIATNCLTCQNGSEVNSSATWYLDADNDGHAISWTVSCLSPGLGYTTTVLPIDDCDDSNGLIHPGAADTNCNGIDEDCDGTADDGYVAANCLTCQNGSEVNSSATWYLDVDTDGHAASSTVSCLSPGLGYTTTVLPIGDCDDANGAIHPGAADTNCNGIDEDCDGTADDGYVAANCLTCQSGVVVNSSATWYLDGDTDGHAISSTVSCLSPGLGYTTTVLPIDDCDDANGSIHPGAADTNCNNIDEDCDGTPDDGYIAANCLTCQNGVEINSSATWYLDADTDGHAVSSTVSCLSPGLGYTTTVLPIDDCDDSNGSIHPGATDTNCNNIDEDCDGTPDDGYIAANCLTCQNGSEVNSSATWYLDADTDGHAISSTVSCLSPGLGYTTTVLLIDDCNDNNGLIHLGADDANCNGIDEDCDGTPDDGYIPANCLTCQNGVVVNSSATWYLDADADGHAASSTISCLSPGTGYTTTILPIDDCDDNNGSIHPGASDTNCNGIDEDCDGTPDDGYIAANCLSCQNGTEVNSSATWYLDADTDGHATSSTVSCLSPGLGYTTTVLPLDDCDDANGSIHPGAADTNCNNIDEDCDGTPDDDYIAANCLTCQNGIIVNSSVTWYLDADMDGHAISSTVSCLSPGAGYTTTVLPIDDCNDANVAIHPGASDTNCNNIDEDCDGTPDDGYIAANCLTCQNGSEVNSSATWYLDADTDGYAISSIVSCLSPGLGYTTTVLLIDDCNDANSAIHPGASDTNCNGIDEDCDGTPDDGYIAANCLTCQNGTEVNSSVTWYLDADTDGHATSSTVSCLSPGLGYTTTVLPLDDCDDANGSIHPGASDTNCNNIDEDCDGTPDDGYIAANCLTCQNGVVVNSSATWYLDADTDGHAVSSTVSCLSPGLEYTTTVLPIDDCDDANGSIHPGASDTNCNNIDEDCDGAPDDGYIAANCLTCQNGIIVNSSATWYLDADMDGHAISSTVSCLSPGAGYTTTVLPIDDCNDANGAIHPGASDTNCNIIDEDCNGTPDDGYIAANCLTCQNGSEVNSSATWYLDADTDGHAISSTVSCLSPGLGYTTTVLPIDDCNDNSGLIHPGAADTNCNGIDEDCDGTPDDGYIPANCLTCQNGVVVNSSSTWYLDADADGHAASSTISCLSPGLGHTTTVLPIDDCDDANGSIHPGATDTNCNNIDEDCDGTPDDGYIAANCLTCQNGSEVNSSATWYLDADNDGHAVSSTVSCLSPGLGYTITVLPIDDCNDANGAIHPGVADTNCNGIDEDCDGTPDDGYIPANCLTCQNGSEVNSSATWYLDADTDGHAISSTVSCLSPGLGYIRLRYC